MAPIIISTAPQRFQSYLFAGELDRKGTPGYGEINNSEEAKKSLLAACKASAEEADEILAFLEKSGYKTEISEQECAKQRIEEKHKEPRPNYYRYAVRLPLLGPGGYFGMVADNDFTLNVFGIGFGYKPSYDFSLVQDNQLVLRIGLAEGPILFIQSSLQVKYTFFHEYEYLRYGSPTFIPGVGDVYGGWSRYGDSLRLNIGAGPAGIFYFGNDGEGALPGGIVSIDCEFGEQAIISLNGLLFKGPTGELGGGVKLVFSVAFLFSKVK